MYGMGIKDICKSLAANNDEYIFLSAICDKMADCRRKNILTATRFLDSRQQALVQQLLSRLNYRDYHFDGGVLDAERKTCIFLPDYSTEHELFRVIRAEKAKQDMLTHRDYLGSLMGLQIKRECIGDIFVHDNGADIVVLSEIAEYVMMNYQKAGRKQLILSYIMPDEICTGYNDFAISTVTVSSLRLDCVVGAAWGMSRAVSSSLIEKGGVALNAAECIKSDKLLQPGDKITIRGKGKIEILVVLGYSKKGKIFLEIKQYG